MGFGGLEFWGLVLQFRVAGVLGFSVKGLGSRRAYRVYEDTLCHVLECPETF